MQRETHSPLKGRLRDIASHLAGSGNAVTAIP